MIVSQRLTDTIAAQQSGVRSGSTPWIVEEHVSRTEVLLEEALDDSFPASDPLSSLRFD